ncbi:MAG TPA: VWA domain-containing protein [Acidimicrobiales bacterium]|nr:VWA domain-containing protein [Acidimicrobiales bacterium]
MSADGPARIVTGFVRALRAGGLSVPTGAAVAFAEALGLLGLEDPDRVYWAGRATLVRRPEDVERYDQTFSAYWAGVAAPAGETPQEREVTLALDSDEAVGGEDPAEHAKGDVQAVRYSPAEVLSQRDLATLGPEEWAEAQRLVSALKVTTELRSSRRTRPSRRRAGDHPDLRRTFRRNVRFRGVPVERAWREPAERPRRTVFLLDVSGSMEPYSRALVRFAHAAVASRRAGEVEVFALGTRLTRITKELSRRNPETALQTAAGAVSDWSGGTRLGETIGRFNDLWGVRGMARGAVVVVFSDGWDRGAPEVMAAEMARLARVARRVVWVNPLKATPGYAPLARGMAAALPYVDQFVEGHSVSSLEQLAAVLAAGPRREEVHR